MSVGVAALLLSATQRIWALEAEREQDERILLDCHMQVGGLLAKVEAGAERDARFRDVMTEAVEAVEDLKLRLETCLGADR